MRKLGIWILNLIAGEMVLWVALTLGGVGTLVVVLFEDLWPYFVVPGFFLFITTWEYLRVKYLHHQAEAAFKPFIAATWIAIQDEETRYRWAVKNSPDLSPKQKEQEVRRLDRGGEYPRTHVEHKDIRRLNARLDGIQKALSILVKELHWHEDGPSLRAAHGGLPTDAPIEDRVAAILADPAVDEPDATT